MAAVGLFNLVKVACVWVPNSSILRPLFMQVYGAAPASTPNWRVRCHSLIIQLFCHHQFCQILPKFERWHCRFLPRTGPRLYRIHLCNRAKKSKLSIWPPFHLPNLLKPNRIMPTIVDIVHPMLRTIVAAERLGIFERLPLSVNEPVRRVILNLVEDPVR